MDGQLARLLPWLAALAALTLFGVLLSRFWSTENASTAPHREPATETRAPAVAETDAPTGSEHDAEHARLDELRAMSETFRNTTFLIAIRDAGFMCIELVSVYGGLNESATWTATCNDMLAYTVNVTSTGALAVAPIPQYLDGLAPRPIDQQAPIVVPREPR